MVLIAQASAATSNVDVTLPRIPKSSYKYLQNLTYTIGGKDFTITPDQQIAPVAQVIDGDSDSCAFSPRVGADRADYLLFFVSDEGLDAIVGQVFFERYYVTLDTDQSRVGVAKTQYSAQGNKF